MLIYMITDLGLLTFLIQIRFSSMMVLLKRGSAAVHDWLQIEPTNGSHNFCDTFLCLCNYVLAKNLLYISPPLQL